MKRRVHFFNIEHHAEIYPQTLSTETKTVLTRNSQPSSSRNLNDVNIKNLETHFANLWDPHSLSADPTQDSLEMHQIDQSKEDFPSRSTQSNMSDRWKIVLNYNEDDQKLLEEMLDFQDGQNLLEEMLSSQDNQEVVTFKLPTSSQSSIFLRKPHGKDTPMAFRTLTLESSKYDGKIDNLKNLENKKRKISSIYKTEKSKTPKLELKKQTVKQERKKLVDILINNFTIGPKKMEQPDEVNTTAIKNSLLAKKNLEEESKYQRSLDIKILNFLEKVDCEGEILNFRDVNSSSSRAFDSVPNAVSKRAQIRTFEYIQRIQWKGSESFKKEISDLVGEFQDLKKANPPKAIPGRIRDISTVGVTLMKIISKFYSTNPRSEEYGNNQYILNYTKEFWKIYFLDKENMDQELEIFCRSIGAKSESEIDKCISIRFTSRKQGLSKIIPEMRKHILLRVDKNKLLQYAWYFALIRASVFFPEDILIPDSSEVRLNYRKFISYGIMYFVLKYG
ncbi:hypothetical protein BY996DRAFT_31642 [Phakopsora pachyrhizi]|nr:hypothetical protein BY996DRAFT_31642 [Phakopsora pachyrhizi]